MGAASVRYGIPAAIFLVGQVILVATGDWVSWAAFTGGALAVLLVSALFRIGIEGDLERDREEEARAYFDEHGIWPDDAEDEPASTAPGREAP